MTLSSSVMAGRSLTCWKVRAMPAAAMSARQAARDVSAEEADLARARRQRSGDQVEHGALAGAVGTDQADDLAGLDLEADIVDGDQAAEALDGAVDSEQRRTRPAAASAAAGAAYRPARRGAASRRSEARRNAGISAAAGVLQDQRPAARRRRRSRAARRCSTARKHVLQQFLSSVTMRRADHGSADRAPAPPTIAISR